VKIDPNANNLEQEILNFDESDQILSVYVNQIFFILVTFKGIFVYDTLSRKQINKCTFPRYFLKYLDWQESQNSVRIEHLEESRFLFIWGSSLAQIWDFNPRANLSKILQKMNKTSSEADKGLLGSKATRKYTKYAVNSGIQEWSDECGEEARMDFLRDRLNIDGLDEEEMIAYAKLISQAQEPTETLFDDSDMDPDLKLALQLSLIEM
jgi:hypothetical protein